VELGDLASDFGLGKDRKICAAHLGQRFIQWIYSQHTHLDVAERRGHGRAAQEGFGAIPRFTLEYEARHLAWRKLRDVDVRSRLRRGIDGPQSTPETAREAHRGINPLFAG